MLASLKLTRPLLKIPGDFIVASFVSNSSFGFASPVFRMLGFDGGQSAYEEEVIPFSCARQFFGAGAQRYAAVGIQTFRMPGIPGFTARYMVRCAGRKALP